MKNIYLKGVIMSELVMKERISVLKDKMLSEKRYASIEQAKIITDTYSSMRMNQESCRELIL